MSRSVIVGEPGNAARKAGTGDRWWLLQKPKDPATTKVLYVKQGRCPTLTSKLPSCPDRHFPD